MTHKKESKKNDIRHLRSDRHKFDHVTSTDPERACDLDRLAIGQASR